jgi:hypothetical protein
MNRDAPSAADLRAHEERTELLRRAMLACIARADAGQEVDAGWLTHCRDFVARTPALNRPLGAGEPSQATYMHGPCEKRSSALKTGPAAAGLSPMEQLIGFVEWERKHNPPPPGQIHIAEWALREIERLRTAELAGEGAL